MEQGKVAQVSKTPNPKHPQLQSTISQQSNQSVQNASSRTPAQSAVLRLMSQYQAVRNENEALKAQLEAACATVEQHTMLIQQQRDYMEQQQAWSAQQSSEIIKLTTQREAANMEVEILQGIVREHEQQQQRL
ncbi:hypothetical protein EJ06DRAFT_556524 [Trichodelitschia bisporula]|uniref:Uncharacterized protein n=1 Tax=Trichodelitschia bisporula TaxID=703511 RepID=A0A6G1HWC2_9PEZI|nr:hypothetical protein EJ06DRAFT_556524 [Trichodelitschia bisporula]